MERKVCHKQRRRYSELKIYENHHNWESEELFIDADSYPAFFDENLLDDDRQIKIFKRDPHTHEIIFYFQLLKVIYECEDSDYEKYLQKIYDIIENPEFEIITPRLDNHYAVGLSSAKMKRVLIDFLEEMGEGQLSVQEGLKKYPIVNKLFVLFLRSILIIGQQCTEFDEHINANEVYDLLANYFELEITYYGNCLRFNQVDVFVYLQSENEVYLAYILPSSSQQEILDSSELYHNDPEEVFNISSVKQMVSEIDIPVDTQCFNTSKNNDDTEEIDYNYSHSEDVRLVSRSVQEGSELKFSYLINEDSLQNLNVIKSNKILEKSLIGDKKSMLNYKFVPQIDCYQIEQAPPELENAISPILTPRQTKFVSFGRDEAQKFDKENIYSRKKKSTNIKDIIKEEYELLSTYESGFKKNQTYDTMKETAESEWDFKREALQILGGDSVKPQGTLKSLYELKSIKSICDSNSESFLIGDTPKRLSKVVSRNPTVTNRCEEVSKIPAQSKNASGDFTNSFILRQMQEPFQSSIRTMKTRARGNRANLQKMMLF